MFVSISVYSWDDHSAEDYRYFPHPPQNFHPSFGQRNNPSFSPGRNRGTTTYKNNPKDRINYPGRVNRDKSVDLTLFDRPCQCIKLSQCFQFIEILSRTSVSSISSELAHRFRQASCGFRNTEPIVCCPIRGRPSPSVPPHLPRFGGNFGKAHEYFPVATTEESSWVWDVEQDNSAGRTAKPHNDHHDDFEDNNHYHPGYSGFGQRFPGHNHLAPGWGYKRGKFFFANFEDPKSHKNCPPPFSMEFDLPNSIEPEPPKLVNDIVLPPSPKYTPTTTTISPSVIPDATPDTPPATEPPEPMPTISPNAMDELEGQRMEKMKLINSELCGISVNTRIIGGVDAGINQFPWMARLAYRNRSE